jgi:large repetitive protein
MVSAINFAVRDGAGKTQLGSLAGEGQSNLIAVRPGEAISLNLSPGSVVAYTQQGNDLLIQLIDGRTIVLSGYFAAPDGAVNKLYLSSYDNIVEVRVTDGVDGVLFADYGPVQAMEKWSPLDGLRFSQSDVLDDALAPSNEPAGMAGLVPGLLAGGGTAAGLGGLGTAAALAGGAALLGAGGGGGTGDGTGGGGTGGGGTGGGGTGGGGTGGGHTPPTVDQTQTAPLTTNTSNPSVVVTGTGHPGDTVVVSVGPNTSQPITIGNDGTWSATFTGPNLPPDGTYVPSVTVTNSVTGGNTSLTGPTYVIDMTPPAFAIGAGTTSVGDIHNIATYAASGGRTIISGTGEVGATMTVTANNHTLNAIVQPNGTWSVSFTQEQIPGSDFRQVPVAIFATDINGNNSATFHTTIAIDTVANPIVLNTIAGDGTVNLIEAQGGFWIMGRSVAGAQLTVNIEGVVSQASANAQGDWRVFYSGGLFGQDGSQDGIKSMTVSSTDAANNPNVQTFLFRVDTQATAVIDANQGFGSSINAQEALQGVNITGRADAGSQVEVRFEGQTRFVVADGDGQWSAQFNLAHLVGANAIDATGRTVSVTATDPYGNTEQTTQTIIIDTRPPNDPIVTGDVGNSEGISGLLIANAPSSIQYFAVSGSGGPQQLAASRLFAEDANGNPVYAGQVNFASTVPNGTYLVIRDVDAAGNESSTLHLRAANEVTLDMTREGLQGFDFGTINLMSAAANLTLDTARVLALTGADRQMTITGDGDDRVTLLGAQMTQTTVTSSQGETYRLYTLGSGASVLVDEDIPVNWTS